MDGPVEAEIKALPLRAGKRIRLIKPYPYTFATFAKARWIGRTVLDVYHDEFGSYPKIYYESAINEGRILVSGERVTCNYKIKGGDELTHTVHRHEPAVSVCDVAPSCSSSGSAADEKCGAHNSASCSFAESKTSPLQQQTHVDGPLVKVIHEDESVIVVDKPSTLPIHPCGGYNYNSLFHILSAQEPSLKGKLHTVHRLDRLTSGLTIVAKSSGVAQSLGKCIMDRSNCHKFYLARVKGKFPLSAPAGLRFKDASKLGLGGPYCAEHAKSGHDKTVQIEPPSVHDLDVPRPSPLTNAKNQDRKEVGKAEERINTRVGYWIEDAHGTMMPHATLEDVFRSRRPLVELLDGTAEKEGHQEQLFKTSSSCCGTASATENEDTRQDPQSLWFHLSCPTRIASHKNGVCEAGSFSDLDPALYAKTVKPAQTSFATVAYDAQSDSTVVLVKPVTGRTHQIRLHLQFLGHPIANDPNYGGDNWFGDVEGERASQAAKEMMNAIDRSPDAVSSAVSSEGSNMSGKPQADDTLNVRAPAGATSTDVPATEEEMRAIARQARERDESLLDFIKKTCVWCARSRGKDRTMLEFLVRSRGIWLHALQYSILGSCGKKMCYRTDPPDWSCI